MTAIVSVGSGPVATQLVAAGDGPTLVTNPGPNSVYVGDTDSIRASDGYGVVPLASSGYINVDGVSDLYGITMPGQIQSVNLISGGLSYFSPSPPVDTSALATAANQVTGNNAINTVNNTLGTPAQNNSVQQLGGAAGRSVAQDMLTANNAVTREIAALLATGTTGGSPGGMPMLRFTNGLGNGTNLTIAGAATVNPITNAAVNQPGYEMMIQASLPAAAGTIPFANIILTFSDAATGLIVRTTPYTIALGNGPANVITNYINGPCYGNRVSLQITNLDPAQTMTYTYVLNLTSHVHLTDNIIQPVYPATAPVTFGQPGGTPALGLLCITHPSIGPSATIDRLLAPYSGKVFLVVDDTGLANGVNVSIVDPTGSLYSNLAAQGGAILNVPAGGESSAEIALPRGPMLLRMHNVAATNTITPFIIITTKDY
jgi:hypothetical protein